MQHFTFVFKVISFKILKPKYVEGLLKKIKKKRKEKYPINVSQRHSSDSSF